MNKIESQSEGTIPKPEAVLLTVQIDKDLKDCLLINSEDNPKKLAKDFARKHGLESSAKANLENLISEQMDLFKSPSPKLARPASSRKIHERLYMDSKISRRVSKKATEVYAEKLTSNINYGQLMYEQSKVMNNDKWRENRALKNETREKTEKELTFHPSLPGNFTYSTTGSESFARNKGIIRNNYEPVSVREMKECSFKPKVSSNTRSAGNIHERLYQQGVQKKMITSNERLIAHAKRDPAERKETVNRLLNSHLRTAAKIQRARTAVDAAIDPETQRLKFMPEIGREPQIPLEKPVWDRLYGKEREAEEDSEDIYMCYRIGCYRQIFEKLDLDNSGVITEDSVNHENIQEEFRKILNKVLRVSGKSQMNLQEFIQAMENGVCVLNLSERIILLQRK